MDKPVKFAAVAAEPLTVPLIVQPPFVAPGATGEPVPREVISVVNWLATSLAAVVGIVYVATAPLPRVIVNPEATVAVALYALALVAVEGTLPVNTFAPLKFVVLPIWLISLMIDVNSVFAAVF
jgi:hypothetical protein